MDKKILDVTCGARTIWFDKHHPAAVYCDKRREEYRNLWKNAGNCFLSIDPDVLCDFTALPFPNDTFSLAVFDPPHLTGAKETAWLVKKYGKLDDTWPQMLHDGFVECMRVLKPDGVLIFKWSEYDIPAEKVWRAIGQKPLFGHHSGKNSKTFWGCFMKLEEAALERREERRRNNMRIEEAISIFGEWEKCNYKPTREAAELAISALRAQQEAEKNAPLTLEELREMGGEPYWHVGLQDNSRPPHWSILDPFLAKHIEDYGYGVRWLAYRNRLEGGDTNA